MCRWSPLGGDDIRQSVSEQRQAQREAVYPVKGKIPPYADNEDIGARNEGMTSKFAVEHRRRAMQAGRVVTSRGEKIWMARE
jgi:hypothetical protein